MALALRIETMKLAVPGQELRMRAIGFDFRRFQLARWINDRFYTVTIIYLAMHDDFKVIPESNQATVEHPMRCT